MYVFVRNADGARAGSAWNSPRIDIGRIDICQRLFQMDPQLSNVLRSMCDIVPRPFVLWKCRLINDITRDRRELVFRDRLKDRAGTLFVFGIRVLLFFSIVEWTNLCVPSKVWRNVRFANNNPWQWGAAHLPRRGRGERHVAESCMYDIWLKHYRQRRERAFIWSRAAAHDTVHASRDRSRTAQGSHQRRSHLRVPW